MAAPTPGSPKLPYWYRVLAVIVGLFSISIAFIVLALPGLGLLLVVFLLALGLLVMGMDRLAAGITGHPMSSLFALVPASPPPTQGPGGSPPQH